MKIKLHTLTIASFTLFASFTSAKLFAQEQERRIPLIGFNQDVIADSILSDTPDTLTTASVDNPAASGNVFYAQGFGEEGTAFPVGGGLPDNGSFISTAGHGFQLAPYNQKNDVRLEQTDSVRLFFSAPYQTVYDSLFILATGNLGSPNVNYTINFADSSQSQYYFNALDWYCNGCTTYAISGLSRINRVNGYIDMSYVDSFAIREYAVPLTASDKLKIIKSIDFQMPGETFGVANIFGITGYTSAPLPVSLQFFTAKVVNGSATLEWKSSQEFNNKEYIVERASAIAPANFVQVGIVDATSSSTGSLYHFANNPQASGTYLYRLSQVDIDGNIKILGVRSITFNSHATWQLQDLGAQWKLISNNEFIYRLIDINGNLLKEDKGSGSVIISKPLAHGIYMLQVSVNGVMSSQKVIH